MAMLPRFDVVGSLGWLKAPIEECVAAAHHFLDEVSAGTAKATTGS